jgi:hypothetical protein
MISDPVFKLVITILFYGAVLFLSVMSMLAIYIYLRYSQSKLLAAVISLGYILLFVGMVTNAYRLFGNLL